MIGVEPWECLQVACEKKIRGPILSGSNAKKKCQKRVKTTLEIEFKVVAVAPERFLRTFFFPLQHIVQSASLFCLSTTDFLGLHNWLESIPGSSFG
jgi:hypothetical protein